MADEQRFTPGPWETHQSVEGTNSVRVCKPVGGGLCKAIGEAEVLKMPRLEAEANARLIAAAPEMYEVLKELEFSEIEEVGDWDMQSDASILEPGAFLL